MRILRPENWSACAGRAVGCWQSSFTGAIRPREACHIFLDVVCPGMQFDSLDDWVRLYTAAGLAEVQARST
jgi:hypothetical protein